jgi:glycosyltransferase involved in cell wall biosynthesis
VRELTITKLDKKSIFSEKINGVICFGGEDWWYHNRGHIDMQIMRRFARMGTMLYINSIVMQKPNLREGRKFLEKLRRKTKSIFTGLKKVDDNFWVYSPFSLPVVHIRVARWLNDFILRLQIYLVSRKLGIKKPLVWVACPAASVVALRLKRAKLVYQRTDRFEEFPNVDAETIKRFDLDLKTRADLTIFVSRILYEQEQHQCRKAIFLDHGVDYEMFASAGNNPTCPDDIAGIPRPIIGFYGGFAEHTTDISLLEKVVDLLADKSFVFVGQPSAKCAALRAKANVWILGQKPYEQIPHYGKCFDVAIMPWKQNRWIEACNPIKLKEYLALGKPVVSTPFSELNYYLDVVYQAKAPDEFAAAIVRALSENNAARIAARQNKVAPFTWDSKAGIVLNELFSNHNSANNATC